MTNDREGKQVNSLNWIISSFAITSPCSFVNDIVCNDDCENCPLYKRGCGKRCVRWDDLVCTGCPCLGSKYVKTDDRPQTVNPTTLIPEPMDPFQEEVRKQRVLLDDGKAIDLTKITINRKVMTYDDNED